jgi:hypothetical protein
MKTTAIVTLYENNAANNPLDTVISVVRETSRENAVRCGTIMLPGLRGRLMNFGDN